MAAARKTGGQHDIVVVGGSAGGLDPLMQVVRALPPDLAAALFVVLHGGNSDILANLLNRSGALKAVTARNDQPIEHGHIYLAPPDAHLLIRDGRVRLGRGPKENGFRPAVDPLFRTAARACGPRVIGVILSGALDDGTHGMSLIQRHGGKTVVQDPSEAFMPSMPRSVRQNMEVDYTVPCTEIGALIARLSEEPISAKPSSTGQKMDPDDTAEPDLAEYGSEALASKLYDGPPSTFTCPECGGTLWELQEGQPVRYRCHVGHGFTGESLLAQQDESLEAALWTAVRALDETAALSRRMAERARAGKLEGLNDAYNRRAEAAQDQANIIRNLLVSEPENSLESGALKNGVASRHRKEAKPERK